MSTVNSCLLQVNPGRNWFRHGKVFYRDCYHQILIICMRACRNLPVHITFVTQELTDQGEFSWTQLTSHIKELGRKNTGCIWETWAVDLGSSFILKNTVYGSRIWPLRIKTAIEYVETADILNLWTCFQCISCCRLVELYLPHSCLFNRSLAGAPCIWDVKCMYSEKVRPEGRA